MREWVNVSFYLGIDLETYSRLSIVDRGVIYKTLRDLLKTRESGTITGHPRSDRRLR